LTAQKNKLVSTTAFQRWKKNTLGVVASWYIVLCGLVAVFAYTLAPDNSQHANQMHLEIHSKAPGFQVNMLTIPAVAITKQSFVERLLYGSKNKGSEIPISSFRIERDVLSYETYSNDPTENISKAVQLTVFKGADPTTFINKKTFYLGTDKYGRDLLSRMLVGTRISFFVGFIAVCISLVLGIGLGATAGYFGGRTDTFILWLINITWSIPTLLLVIAITLALGKGFWQVFIAVGLTMWVEVARVVRGQVMSEKKLPYIEAAKVLGYKHFTIILKHLLPNIMGPVIVIAATNFAAAILIESGLSFLGIGAQPPTPSWGAMIKDHYSYIILGKAYLAVIPGMAIMSLVMAFMLVGNALRDALDVKA